LNDPRAAAVSFLEQWSRHHARRDIDSLVDLYAEGALFFGSTPELQRGRDAIRAYFEHVPHQPQPHVRFDLLAAESPAPGLVNIASIGTFQWTGNPGTRVRFTHVLTEGDGTWRAAVHHATVL
jgi:uncharacterized protein (TIGR02246 family)